MKDLEQTINNQAKEIQELKKYVFQLNKKLMMVEKNNRRVANKNQQLTEAIQVLKRKLGGS